MIAGSDKSVANGVGAHSYVFTSSIKRTTIWGGAATTPRSKEEMASQRAEHAGSIAVLLILHVFQQCYNDHFQVDLWIDNVEVIRRGEGEATMQTWNDSLVLDFDIFGGVMQDNLVVTTSGIMFTN